VDTYRCAHIGQHPYLLSLRPDGFDRSLTVLKRFSNIYQIVGGNPSSAIRGGMRFFSKTEGLAKVAGSLGPMSQLNFYSKSQATALGKIGWKTSRVPVCLSSWVA
jgi:hypothetical protein